MGKWCWIAWVALLVSCGGEWTAPSDGSVQRCVSSDALPAGRSVLRAAMTSDAQALYILDNWSSLYRYTRDPVRECGWNLDGSWGSGGQMAISGFAEDIDLSRSQVFWMDGSQLGGANGAECLAERGPFAMATDGSGFSLGYSGGLRHWTFTASGCRSDGSTSGLPVLALERDDDGFYTVEGVAGQPQQLAVYNRTGGVLWREPLSATPGSEKYFCSAARLRIGSNGLFLLDTQCRKLGVFDVDGVWRKSLSLDSLGLYGVQDVLPGEQGKLYLLTENQREFTVRLSSLLF